MGTWGFNIFEDDLALDIKDAFQELIDEGETVEIATQIILEEFEDSLEDFDEGVTAVLALGTLALEKGEITDRLKKELINASNNEEYWEYLKDENEELYKSRIVLLHKLMKIDK